jgi:mutator protein MutT
MLLNTVCLPVRKGRAGEEVLLARKKVGFGIGKVVGVGGTVEPSETIPAATVREVQEELEIEIREKDLILAARLGFTFPARPEWNRIVFVYLVRRWQGEPQSTREVDPFWLPIEELPAGEMWADSGIWLPRVLRGERLIGRFTFQSDNETLDHYELKPDRDFLWPQLQSLPYFRALLRAVEANQYQDLDLPEPVLDLGSGDGHFASVAFDSPLDVGLDPWWEPLDESRQYAGVYKGLVQAEGAEMPFPEGHFASALSNSVLEHIVHIDEVLADTARVLRPGAPFLFCCPNDGYARELSVPNLLGGLGLNGLARRYRDWFMRMSRTQHADPPEAWQARLERAGFQLVRYWHYFSPAALRMLEWGHYLGAPTLLVRKLFGRWIIAPARWNLWLTERLVRPYAGTEPRPDGTYTFYVAVRTKEDSE